MAVRLDVWRGLHGFDKVLGTGGHFRSSEEIDFTLRALAAGFSVFETPDLAVMHYGFRDWGQGRVLIQDYMFGMGAVYAKLLRLEGWRVLVPALQLAWRWLVGRPAAEFNVRPPRGLRLRAFLRGAWEGLGVPVDRASGHFLLEGAVRPAPLKVGSAPTGIASPPQPDGGHR